MDSQLVKVLTNLGLNEKEAKVFLALTEQGTAVVSTISQAAGINRVTTYDVLEKLKQRGLVSFFTKSKVKYFSGINPEILLEEFEKRTNDLRVHLPKFKTLTGEISHPRVRYFEGLDGIKAIYADTLTSKTDILNFSNSDEIRKKWHNYDEEYVEKRAKKGIFLRGVCPKDKAGEIVHAEDEKYHREIRLVNSSEFNFTNEINIYDDKVAIISFKEELIGMIIESHEIANSQRAIFNMCWHCASNIINEDELKKKMLSPIKHSEIKESTNKENKVDKVLKDNLSLF
jgi:HTH-type transcriptional regulator, sugar sensing transcriptional regulator